MPEPTVPNDMTKQEQPSILIARKDGSPNEDATKARVQKAKTEELPVLPPVVAGAVEKAGDKAVTAAAAAIGGGLITQLIDHAVEAIEDKDSMERVKSEIHSHDEDYKDDKYRDLTYGELRARLTTSKDNTEKIGLRASERIRLREAASYGVLVDADNELSERLVEADKSDYPAKIAAAAKKAEQRAKESFLYRYNPRIEGVVSSAVGETTVLVKNDLVGNLSDRTRRVVLWDPGLEYATLVNSETAQQKSERLALEKEERDRAHERGMQQQQLDTARELADRQANQGQAAGDAQNNQMEEYYRREAAFQREEFAKIEFYGEKQVGVPESRFFYSGMSETEAERFRLRIRLNNARNKKFETPDALGYFANMNDLEKFSLNDLGILTNGSRIAEAIAIYAAIITRPGDVNLPDLPAANILACKTDDELKTFRLRVANYLSTRFTIPIEEAETCERVAKNFIDVTNLLEHTDSRYSHGYGNAKRSPLTRLVCGVTWDALNIKEKMINGAEGGKPWPKNVVGDWGKAHPKEAVSQKIIPEHLAPDFLRFMPSPSRIGGPTLLDELVVSASKLINGQMAEYSIPWSEMPPGDNPFFGYYLARVHRAATLFTAFESGQAKNWQDIIKASKDLGLAGEDAREFRELLVYLFEKSKTRWIRPEKKDLLPKTGATDLFTGREAARLGFLKKFKEEHPDFI